MILAVDVGNTNITFGIFRKDEITADFRMTSQIPRTADEYGLQILRLLEMNDINKDDLTGAAVSSVVPDVLQPLCESIPRYLGFRPLVVGPGTKTGINIKTDNPSEVGADRIVDIAGAYHFYGGPLLVLDFGTATTYDLVSPEGEFTAGLTAPGIKISAKALWEGTAKLPSIAIEKPSSILARNTITSMQAGLLYGQIGQTEYIIKHMREESGYDDLKVVATGGLGGIIAGSTDMIDVYDIDLTLKGLKVIYDKNQQ
ncbi:MAG: type III pantothenate kinase [Lachnospiraceae bacterium]|nr:type III pantothenate kinase [Lachnospiraceae bacterium]